ncbi:hypothetical protein CEXT_118811 [Caerostris extrusa]|uniref:Uncharacterized protein n=1 Tax=Caerostris extrusa TaxID=172846 RepID=A0AAV4PZ40_CAEEX|nr:hypothetical protein CEXT_118811 [Caerostris extrusa]
MSHAKAISVELIPIIHTNLETNAETKYLKIQSSTIAHSYPLQLSLRVADHTQSSDVAMTALSKWWNHCTVIVTVTPTSQNNENRGRV